MCDCGGGCVNVYGVSPVDIICTEKYKTRSDTFIDMQSCLTYKEIPNNFLENNYIRENYS